MSASLLTLAWKSLANRGVSVALTILSIVLAVMLFLGVEKIRAVGYNKDCEVRINSTVVRVSKIDGLPRR